MYKGKFKYKSEPSAYFVFLLRIPFYCFPSKKINCF